MDSERLEREIAGLDGADVAVLRSARGAAIDEVLAALDIGALRVCERDGDGWRTNAWIKRAILMYFKRHDSVPMGDPAGIGFYDKMPVKKNYAELGARCVPPGVARYGSFLGRGTILMPGFVNVGGYVDEGSMVDTWATVGSCAQIGKNVHLAGGVGIGGVLEPPQAQPVVVEDGAFVGSRCVVVEGVRIGREAVLGAGLVLTGSTPIVDVRGPEPVVTRGAIGARLVAIPGTMPKAFAAGTYGVACALVIGERTASTDRKTSLEAAIRDYGVPV